MKIEPLITWTDTNRDEVEGIFITVSLETRKG